jgi:hypothetical protein
MAVMSALRASRALPQEDIPCLFLLEAERIRLNRKILLRESNPRPADLWYSALSYCPDCSMVMVKYDFTFAH